jgi:glycosyltransferase involved in cell wall biosynthesis
MKKKISVATSCYNEEGNIAEFCSRVQAVFAKFPQYDYEIIIADNCSSDRTRDILRSLAAQDKRLKLLFNSNNFGHIRSPYNAMLMANGDATVALCSDLQDPPELIADFLLGWEKGYKVVCGVDTVSDEPALMHFLRSCYYWLMEKLSDCRQIRHFHGFGLYDRQFMQALRSYRDTYPYLRGQIAEIGFKQLEVPYRKPARKAGKSKNNFFTLYDNAMIGFINHTKLPLRLAVFAGFLLAGCSLLIALGYLVYKLIFWDTFNLGIAPLVIGLFFFSAVQLIFTGIIGEYLGAVWTQVKQSPLAIVEEKINFEDEEQQRDD